jgi:FAD-dependent urate hydroxylase
MKNLSIAIAGAGTAGLASAIYLARAGHQVHLIERSPKLSPLGAGLLLQPTGLSVLRDLDLETQANSLGHRVDRLYGQNASGRRVMDMRYGELGAILHKDLFGLGIQRGALFQTLHSALPESVKVSLGVTLEKLDTDSGTLSDMFGNSIGSYDLVVVCDGAHSVLRHAFKEHCVRDKAYPWGAVWCLVRDKHQQFSRALSQRYRASRQMCGLLPVGHLQDQTVSDDRLCVYWSLPVDKFAEWQLHGLGNWRSHVYELWPEAADLLLQIQHPEETFKATYRDVVHSQFAKGRAVLLGDSAHAMSPQLGQGANMALLDAQMLAQSLEACSSVSDALSRYQTERKAHVAIYQRISRWLTPLFQSDSVAAAWIRDLLMHPVGRLPGMKRNTLQVLAGVQRGYFGRLPVEKF